MGIFNESVKNDNIVGAATGYEIYGLDRNDFLQISDVSDIVDFDEGHNFLLGQSGGGLITAPAGFIDIGNESLYENSELLESGSYESRFANMWNIQSSVEEPALNLIMGTPEVDILNGTDGNDLIYALESDDTVFGGEGDDILYGDEGDDTLNGSAGADTMFGGIGSDTLSYEGSSGAVTISLLDNTASGGDAEGDVISEFENITGSDFDDTLTGDAGDNTLNGGAGADTLVGGLGYDTLSYANSSSAVNVNLSTNAVSGGDAEGDTISSFENVIGSNYDDVLTGASYKNNIFDGGDGIDTVDYSDAPAGTSGRGVYVSLDGTPSPNTSLYSAESRGDIINNVENVIGSNYGDYIYGDDSDNIIYGGGNANYDWLYGGAGNDMIFGEDGNDGIYGEAGDDTLIGGLGADIIDGGDGDDTMIGGLGADTFAYSLESDSISTAYDTITDFTQTEDVMQFEDSVFGTDWTAFSSDVSSGTQTVITHATLTDFELRLTGVYTLDETDFVFA